MICMMVRGDTDWFSNMNHYFFNNSHTNLPHAVCLCKQHTEIRVILFTQWFNLRHKAVRE